MLQDLYCRLPLNLQRHAFLQELELFPFYISYIVLFGVGATGNAIAKLLMAHGAMFLGILVELFRTGEVEGGDIGAGLDEDRKSTR